MLKEIAGELWDYFGQPGCRICITTNGTIKRDGSIVAGRGCANEARKRFENFASDLGVLVRANGNQVYQIAVGIEMLVTFPVKHNWWEKADLALIANSGRQLKALAVQNPEITFYLPRPGCGNGKLDWKTQVRPVLSPMFVGIANVVVVGKGYYNGEQGQYVYL